MHRTFFLKKPMLINHNILRTIIDKVALNRWKSRTRNVCKEYLKHFIYDYDDDHVEYRILFYLCECVVCGETAHNIFYRDPKNVRSFLKNKCWWHDPQ